MLGHEGLGVKKYYIGMYALSALQETITNACRVLHGPLYLILKRKDFL